MYYCQPCDVRPAPFAEEETEGQSSGLTSLAYHLFSELYVDSLS